MYSVMAQIFKHTFLNYLPDFRALLQYKYRISKHRDTHYKDKLHGLWDRLYNRNLYTGQTAS